MLNLRHPRIAIGLGLLALAAYIMAAFSQGVSLAGATGWLYLWPALKLLAHLTLIPATGLLESGAHVDPGAADIIGNTPRPVLVLFTIPLLTLAMGVLIEAVPLTWR